MNRIVQTVSLALLVSAAALPQQSFRGTHRVETNGPVQVAQRSGEESVWSYTVRRQDGTIVSEVNRSIPYDVAAPAPVVFESGGLLLIHSFDGMAELFDRSGDLVRRILLTGTPQPDHERTIQTAVHDRVVILSMADAQGDGVEVLRVDDEGSVVSRRRLEGMSTNGIAVGEDASLAAVSTMRWEGSVPAHSTSFVKDGDETWTIPGGFRKGMFGKDGRFLGLDQRSLFTADIRARKLLWRMESGAGTLFIDAVETESGVTVLSADMPKLLEGKWTYTSPETKRVDWTGKVVAHGSVTIGSFLIGGLELVSGSVKVRLDGKLLP